jgi:hypothetical protein
LKPGQSGTYDASSKRSLKSSREKSREDKIIIMEILPEFVVMCNHFGSSPAEDELPVTRVLRTMFKTKKVPV